VGNFIKCSVQNEINQWMICICNFSKWQFVSITLNSQRKTFQWRYLLKEIVTNCKLQSIGTQRNWEKRVSSVKIGQKFIMKYKLKAFNSLSSFIHSPIHASIHPFPPFFLSLSQAFLIYLTPNFLSSSSFIDRIV